MAQEIPSPDIVSVAPLRPASEPLRKLVDPFIGTEPVDLPAPPSDSLAARWWWPKPQIGNTHPGATLPFGMISACAYSGGYPTGYGRYGKSTEGLPPTTDERKRVSGFTHLHPSGVGAIRKYYNYAKVIPITHELGGLARVGRAWPLTDEHAEPGYYKCTVGETGIEAELAVTRRGAVHRYTFPESRRSILAIDFSHGGIEIPDGRTIPLRGEFRMLGTSTAEACVTMEGLALRIAVEVRGLDTAGFESGLWIDGVAQGDRLEQSFDYIRESTYRPWGVYFARPTEPGQTIEVHLAFSLRSRPLAWRNMSADGPRDFDTARSKANAEWDDALRRIRVTGGTQDQRKTFYTALYHALIKPCEANNESPFWPWDGPFYFDLSTMWDMYKTQLPLAMTLMPSRGAEIVNALLTVFEMEGNFPIGYRLARGFDRFAHQASALVHVTLADALLRDIPGIDWNRAATLMKKDFARPYGEAFCRDGLVHPITHTLDLAYGAWCTAKVADRINDTQLADEMRTLADQWPNAYDRATGLLRDSTFYEGSAANYSYRLLHDMPGRIALHGGTERFIEDLDKFFGYGADPITQPGTHPSPQEMSEGYALGRFEGLTNEPDMEAMYSYVFAGRHDRVCEVVRAGMKHCYGASPGGMVGNDDSGAMSSWYVWNAIGIFPVAGQDLFLIGSPLFCETVINVAGQPFTIRAPETSDTHIYVRQAVLDGVALHRPYLTWAQLSGGGTLELIMSDQPTRWGASGITQAV